MSFGHAFRSRTLVTPFGRAFRSRISVTLFLLSCSPALADRNAELNRILEQNAAASAYARMCDEEPMAEQLKSNTMMMLAVNGLDAQTVQMGSAKFTDVVRQTLRGYNRTKDGPLDCPAKVRAARERLTFTQDLIQSTRR